MNFTPASEIPVEIRKMATAIHEAGHALVAIVLERDVTGAILRPNGLSGETQFQKTPNVLLDPNLQENRHIIEDAIVTLMAGKVAEAEHWKRLTNLYHPSVDSHRDDEVEIGRMISAFNFSPEQDQKYRKHCLGRTESLILNENTQKAINEISATLFSDSQIGRSELDKVLKKYQLIS